MYLPQFREIGRPDSVLRTAYGLTACYFRGAGDYDDLLDIGPAYQSTLDALAATGVPIVDDRTPEEMGADVREVI
jgi:hypothetical protein